jgi:hypothetical protein
VTVVDHVNFFTAFGNLFFCLSIIDLFRGRGKHFIKLERSTNYSVKYVNKPIF